VQIPLVTAELGLNELGTMSLGGKKVRANALKHKAMSWKRALKLEEKLEEEVGLLMEKVRQFEHVTLPRRYPRGKSDWCGFERPGAARAVSSYLGRSAVGTRYIEPGAPLQNGYILKL
jgi:hypothetical protein